MLLRCEQKYTNLLSQKDRELQLAAVKEQGLEDKLEEGGLVEAKLRCSIAPCILLKTRQKLELKSSQLDDAHLGPLSPNFQTSKLLKPKPETSCL